MIRVDDVWKSYGGRDALRGATLRVDEGEAVLLSGAAGAGKSTLLRLLYLAEQPDRGSLRIAGRSLSRLQAASIPYVRRNLGVVQQDLRLLLRRTVYENVAVALEVLGLPAHEVHERTISALGQVGLLADAGQPVQGLPAGVQQRVALARAVCTDPPILLCDEPTSNLDPLRAHEALELLARVHQRGTTVLIATHDPSVMAFGLARGFRKATLQQGQVVAGGEPAALLDDLEEPAPTPVVVSPPRPPALPTVKLPALTIDNRGAAALTIESQRAFDRERSLEVSIEIVTAERGQGGGG